MNAITKLNAGALQYAIFISILIAIIVFTFISLTFMQKKIKIRSGFYKRAIENVDKGLQFAKRNEIQYNKTLAIAQGLEKGESTLLKKTSWGVFDLVQVSSKVQNESFRKAALLGGHQKNRTALYVQDLHRPIVLVGNTHIEGEVLLPEKGVKRGSIGGKSYYGDQLIYGPIFRSQEGLPKLKNRAEIIQFSRNFLDDEGIEVFDQLERRKVSCSFFEKTLLISSWDALVLEEMNMQGNIMVHSDSLIFVSRNVFLEDVILLAPKIIIEDGVIGSFQAIASKTIEVGSNCKLNYPSSLVVIQHVGTNNENNESGQIIINNNSEVKGIIGYLTNREDSNNKAQIYIDEKATVTGEVYAEMNVELKGTVFGTVITRGFVASHNGASYQNHVFNGQIIENKLPQQYCGLALEDINGGISKWLY